MEVAANKAAGIRAVNCWSVTTAQRSRNHIDANVLCLGAEFVPLADALVISAYWLKFEFDGGRHQERLNGIKKIEETIKNGTS